MAAKKLTLYGIPNCDTCRRALRWLETNNVEHDFHDVRMDGLSIQTLERWCDRVEWEKLLNKRSLTWRKIAELDKQNLNRNKALALLLEYPTLIRRPVLESSLVTAVGFSEAGYAKIVAKLADR